MPAQDLMVLLALGQLEQTILRYLEAYLHNYVLRRFHLSRVQFVAEIAKSVHGNRASRMPLEAPIFDPIEPLKRMGSMQEHLRVRT